MSTAIPPNSNPPSTAERALLASEQRLAAQSAALTQLMARYADSPDSFGERMRGILEVTAHTLGADRVSVWRFERGREWIVCANLYERVLDRHGSGLTLSRRAAPRYFQALDNERVIDASDARGDARTREFLAAYLVPQSIHSMLDVPLRQNGVTVGVFCAEHTSPRAWSRDEQHFAIAIAHLMVAAQADEERRAAVARLADSESRARLLIDASPDAFIGVDSTGLIITWNRQAERTFGWTRDEAIGRKLVETIIPPAFRAAHLKGMERFQQTGEARVVNRRLELIGLHRAGHEVPVEITITPPMRVEGGYFFGAFLRDISGRREP